MSILWYGIDEAGYGPNLGPLVMTAVRAVSNSECRPDLWSAGNGRVGRSGSDGDRLAVDDSKRLYRQGSGFDRLEAAAFAALEAAGLDAPQTLGGLLHRLGVPESDWELERWLGPDGDPPVPRDASRTCVEAARSLGAFDQDDWRLTGLRGVVVGPERFNRELAETESKAAVQFNALVRLLRWVWSDLEPHQAAFIRIDKHGGRHFYMAPLTRAFPDAWIDRGPEGLALSRYVIRGGDRRVELEFRPKADAEDGLVALASIISKVVREHWMAVFNRYWTDRVPGLKPSAGYPVDAARFWRELESHLPALDPPAALWWRRK